MNTDYKVGDLIYGANIYDGSNTSMFDLQFYRKWLPKNKDANLFQKTNKKNVKRLRNIQTFHTFVTQ